MYGVTPNPKEALSGDFKTKFVEFNDRVDVEKVKKQIGLILHINVINSNNQTDTLILYLLLPVD